MPDSSREATESATLLRASAEGVKFLVILQISSRLLTFIVNQVLLRYLSPELLGVSVQFELYMITILYFSRESLRTAVQRYRSASGNASSKTSPDESKKDITHDGGRKPLYEGSLPARSQTVVNLAYIPIALGIFFSAIISPYYAYSFVSADTAAQPYFYHSMALYAFSTLLELCSEPSFALSQQNMQYKLRAASESSAAFTRCILTCMLTIYASKTGLGGVRGIGPLPFAVGQLGYAIVLTGVYVWHGLKSAQSGDFSLGLRKVVSKTNAYHLGYFFKPLSNIALSMWMQASVKHVLTQGDSILIAWLSTTYDQGIYALASNYGSLVARMLFQPLEESARNLFAKLLSQPAEGEKDSKPAADAIQSSITILQTILKFYSLLSLFFFSFGPPLAPLLLRIVAGSRWSDSAAGSVLSSFCYYIPLLAINGITEAFVQSVASSKKLHQQSLWMFAFSIGFGVAGYVFLKELGWGAQGLVWANSVNMSMRILWSWIFIQAYFRENGAVGISLGEITPDVRLVSSAVLLGGILRRMEGLDSISIFVLGKVGALGLLMVAICAGTERNFFRECYRLVKSK
ncbi:oligosaccharide translocation protein RFT1 [Peziza echinospora]|nr:oligosaccharide translocation protein RFT1 [Peziza echinospora]